VRVDSLLIGAYWGERLGKTSSRASSRSRGGELLCDSNGNSSELSRGMRAYIAGRYLTILHRWDGA